MKQFLLVIPLMLLLSCGGSESSEESHESENPNYEEDHQWMVSAKALKEKLGTLHASFMDLAHKDIEETVCSEGTSVEYTGNPDEMNIWLMSNYMLDNFSTDDFGMYDFRMPEEKMKNETPLTEFNWMNFSRLDDRMFSLYRMYPELTEVPKRVEKDGMQVSNDELLQNTDMALNALEDGLFGVVALVDYLPPTYVSETEFETGYIMGYVLFADWQKGEMGCMTPFVAQNSEEIDYTFITGNNQYSKEVSAMNADLQLQTEKVIDSIARVRTGFEGTVYVNSSVNLESYRD